MRRISLIILAALALTVLVSAYSQTPTQQTNRNVQVQQTSQAQGTDRDGLITPAMKKEYLQLLKSRSSKAAVQDWARKYKLRIVHLKEYDILVPEQPPTREPEEVGACDATKCPIAVAYMTLKNRLGEILGEQEIKCKAGSCKWIKDLQGRYLRLCGSWKCENVGPLLVRLDSGLSLKRPI